MKTNHLMLYVPKAAVCSEIYTNHKQCGQSAQLLNVKPVGAPRKE